MTEQKKQTIYAILLNGISKFVTYLLLLVLANLYFVESYGESSFIMAIFNIVLFFTMIGLPFVFVPWVINKKDINSIFYFLSLIVFIFTLICIPLLFFKSWIYPLFIAMPFVLSFNLSSAFLRVQGKYGLVQFFNVFMMVITLLIAIALKQFDKVGIIWSYSLGYIIPAIPMVYIERSYFKAILSKFSFNFISIKEYLKKGFIVSLIILSFNFLSWIDSTVLGIMSTFENVAKYNIASPISNLMTIIPLSVSMFLLTRTSEVKNVLKSKNILKRTINISYFSSIIIALLIIPFLSLALNLFFPNYKGIEIYITLLIIGSLFYCVYLLFYTYLTSKLTPEKAFFPLVTGALTNLVLDIILIPHFGLYGICIATLIAHMLTFTLLTFKMKLLKEFIFIYPLSFLILLSYFLGYYGLFLIPITILLLFLFKLITIEDIKVIKDTVFSIINLK